MKDNFVRYAIIGSGATGAAIARQFARKGTIVAIASSRGFAALRPIVEALGPNIVPCSIPAALDADVLILAEPLSAETRRLAKRQDWVSFDARRGTSNFVAATCG